MSTRLAVVSCLLVTSISFAQEESPPVSSPAAGSRAAVSPESTIPPLSASVTPAPSSAAPQLTDVLFKNLKARAIGPAIMGGRVSDIAIDPRNPFVFYVALGHGGIFKSGDAGVTFDPIFDKQPDLSIGAIAIAPSDSDVIWVGTGEANDRNSSDWGNGVYRTTDGGEHWTNVGLKDSRCIARIVVDPKNPDTQCANRLRRCDSRSEQCANCLCNSLRAPAHAVEFRLRAERNQRRRRRRDFQKHERRRELEKVE
jgi:hypothetical protein